MSLVCFNQRDDHLAGVSLYDANPEWTLTDFSTSGGLIRPGIETDEGTGAWIVFKPSEGLWGTILRSEASPYNDCLPPSEAYLLDAFGENHSLDGVLEHLGQSTDDQFINPFRSVLGDVTTGSCRLFHGSFQSTEKALDPGNRLLVDNRPPQETPPFPDIDLSKGTTTDKLKQQITEILTGDHFEEYLAQDGMRRTRSATVFVWDGDRLSVEHSTVIPPEDDWTSTETSGLAAESGS